MIPAEFEYLAPKTVDEALQLLARHGAEAKLLAGGHSLIPLLKLRLAAPRYLVDLARVPGLNRIVENGGRIEIGAMTTHAAIAGSDVLRAQDGVLSQAAAEIGDMQVRNCGTIGGSLAHADPAADYPAAVLALDAEIVVRGPKGERVIAARDFFLDLFTTALGEDELITAVRVAPLPARTGGAYLKVRQPASGFALVGVAAVVTLDAGGAIGSARIGVTGLSASPFRAKAAEQALAGKRPDEATLRAAVERVTDGVEPLNDIHASAAYRSHLARVYSRRALERAAGSAI